jgi:hypothetical protein
MRIYLHTCRGGYRDWRGRRVWFHTLPGMLWLGPLFINIQRGENA